MTARRPARSHRRATPRLLRADGRQDHVDLEALDALHGARQALQGLGLAGVRGAGDRDARALADRGQPLDRLERRVVGPEREALGRQRARQVVEVRALGDLVGRAAVDRVDPDQRRVALRAARLAHRPADRVAGDELAAAHLRGGDVDVVVGRLRRREAHEARTRWAAARRCPR